MVLFDPHDFATRAGAWLLSGDKDADVVISCRARLARNVQGYPFATRLEAGPAEQLCTRLRDLILEQRIDGETIWVGIDDASPVVRLLLRERHLASRDLAPVDQRERAGCGRAVAFGESEQLSVMINEEDHLRLQGLAAGFDLAGAWERVRDLDRALESVVDFAVSDRLGYLTGCPTNVGTGLRASVMLHLPGLGMVRSELEKVFEAAQRTGLAVRGMYGEGSRAAGDFYQISNQTTLGRTEDQLIEDLGQLVPHIVAFERQVREALLDEQKSQLVDRVSRSQGMLRTARAMPTEVALAHLANVRLGVCLGLVEAPAPGVLNRVAIQIQKGHVQALSGEESPGDLAEPTERDRLRASFLRRMFG
jgi:protein arginine kinase